MKEREYGVFVSDCIIQGVLCKITLIRYYSSLQWSPKYGRLETDTLMIRSA